MKRPHDCPDSTCQNWHECDECLEDLHVLMETMHSKDVGTLGDRVRVTWSQTKETE